MSTQQFYRWARASFVALSLVSAGCSEGPTPSSDASQAGDVAIVVDATVADTPAPFDISTVDAPLVDVPLVDAPLPLDLPDAIVAVDTGTTDTMPDRPAVGPSACASAAQCDDGFVCTEDSCLGGTCRHVPINALCGSGRICDLRRDCQPARPCGTDADCVDTDPCTVRERCDPSQRLCDTRILDGDLDGIPPISCGGGDCNDNNPIVGPGAGEACNGRDDNCNGVVDEMVDPLTCAPNQVCLRGRCECNPANLCGTTCADFQTDRAHCGGCGRACPSASTCSGGHCVCPTFAPTRCGGSCVDTNTSPDHCGGCDRRCTVAHATSLCWVGRCEPPVCNDGYADCDGDSANGCETEVATSLLHCGRCGNACPDGMNGVGVCRGGACTNDCRPTFHLCSGTCVTNNSPATCGSSCRGCSSTANGQATCDGTSCSISCNPGYFLCDHRCLSSPCGMP